MAHALSQLARILGAMILGASVPLDVLVVLAPWILLALIWVVKE